MVSWVRQVASGSTTVVVTVTVRRRNLYCPHGGFETAGRHDTRPVESFWRHLDLGTWRLEVRARLRRLSCPDHGMVTVAVPFARAGSHFTRDFEDLVGFLATTADTTTFCRLVRIDWDTVGRIITRVMGDKLDPARLNNLFEIGVEEVTWKRWHHYLTLVSNHRKNQVV
jgi:transposase